MKIKRFVLGILICITIILFSGCSDKSDYINKENSLFDFKSVKYGNIKPYNIDYTKEHLLQLFNQNSDLKVYSFKGPKDAISMKINIYKLNDINEWEKLLDSGISIGEEKIPSSSLEGEIGIEITEEKDIIININSDGIYSIKSERSSFKDKLPTNANIFLNESKDIKLNEEIPIGFVVYTTNNQIVRLNLDDFFNPSMIEEAYYIEAITLNFSDKEF